MTEPSQTGNYFDEFISLREAAKYCRYSQEYLSLRARQGKLKAIKIGRNWVTKKEWIDEYLKRVSDFRNRIPDSSSCLPQPVSQKALATVVTLVFILRGMGGFFSYSYYKPLIKNHPNYVREDLVKIGEEVNKGTIGNVGKYKNLTYFKDSISGMNILENVNKNAYNNLTYFGGEIENRISYDFKTEIFPKMKRNLKNLNSWFVENIKDRFIRYVKQDIHSLRRLTGNFYHKFIQIRLIYFKKGVRRIREVIQNKVRSFLGNMKYVIIEEILGKKGKIKKKEIEKETFRKELLPTSKKEGVIVVPSTGETEKDEEIKSKLKALFSDEIKVKSKDKTSGVIVPIFKEREGQEYLYIMVPVKE